MPSTQRKTSLAAREPFRLLSGQEGGLAPALRCATPIQDTIIAIAEVMGAFGD